VSERGFWWVHECIGEFCDFMKKREFYIENIKACKLLTRLRPDVEIKLDGVRTKVVDFAGFDSPREGAEYANDLSKNGVKAVAVQPCCICDTYTNLARVLVHCTTQVGRLLPLCAECAHLSLESGVRNVLSIQKRKWLRNKKINSTHNEKAIYPFKVARCGICKRKDFPVLRRCSIYYSGGWICACDSCFTHAQHAMLRKPMKCFECPREITKSCKVIWTTQTNAQPLCDSCAAVPGEPRQLVLRGIDIKPQWLRRECGWAQIIF
jgi:hypothetical protein